VSCVQHEPLHEPVADTKHSPPCSHTVYEVWRGCHGGTQAETRTMRMSPEDHAWTKLELLSSKSGLTELLRVKRQESEEPGSSPRAIVFSPLTKQF
jgi:hypothetical protein